MSFPYSEFQPVLDYGAHAKCLGASVAVAGIARAREADDHLGTVLGCTSHMVTRALVCHLETSTILQCGQTAGAETENAEPIFCHELMTEVLRYLICDADDD